MKSIKMALLGGAAIAVSAAGAHADELQDLKAQVEALNARMAAMETAPSVPAGYQLLAVSKGSAVQVPGLEESARERAAFGDRATIISVMPTADAPAGTTISWSGYVLAGLVYESGTDYSISSKASLSEDGSVVSSRKGYYDGNDLFDQDSSWNVKVRGQLKVVATTDTAVGEVGVKLNMRADYNGNGTADVYMETAWGWWAMTPELTLGGGYTNSLGKITYGAAQACTCYFTANGDIGFNPGDTTQLRLSYGSGPFSMAIALEDAGLHTTGWSDTGAGAGELGVAGQIKYSGDSFSGMIAGDWRAVDQDYYPSWSNIDSVWQIGAGLAFNLGDMASISLAAAFGEGPYEQVNQDGNITDTININNQWWGVSGLASANLSDTIHAEIGAGYKHREGTDSVNYYDSCNSWGCDTEVGKIQPLDYNTWSVLAGLYYNPVDQLTIGIEGEYYTTTTDLSAKGNLPDTGPGNWTTKYDASVDTENWQVDLVSVWRF